jgi:hypothetical protein
MTEDTFGLAQQFIELLPEDLTDHIVQSDSPNWGQGPTFDDEAVELIADRLQAFIASVIASLIDAGSEREAIMEDEKLSSALHNVLKEW